MYNSIPKFPYIHGRYMVMPAGLPERFYQKDKDDRYEWNEYVICFDHDVPNEIRKHFINDFKENDKKEKELGYY